MNPGAHSLSVCFTVLCSLLHKYTSLCSQDLYLNAFIAVCASDLPWLILWLLYGLLAKCSSKFSVFKGCLWVFWFTSREDLLGVLAFRLGRTLSSTDTQRGELPVQVLSWGNSCGVWVTGGGWGFEWFICGWWAWENLNWCGRGVASGQVASLCTGENRLLSGGLCAGERHILPLCCLLGLFYLKQVVICQANECSCP